MSNQTLDGLLAKFSVPPEGSVFSLSKVEKVTHPHPYCITPKHVAVASEYYGGILGEAAIAGAEARGAVCETCRDRVRNGRQPGILPYSSHVTDTALFIEVPQNKDLNAVPGLHAYLLSVKELAESLGVTGFAFPTKGQ